MKSWWSPGCCLMEGWKDRWINDKLLDSWRCFLLTHWSEPLQISAGRVFHGSCSNTNSAHFCVKTSSCSDQLWSSRLHVRDETRGHGWTDRWRVYWCVKDKVMQSWFWLVNSLKSVGIFWFISCGVWWEWLKTRVSTLLRITAVIHGQPGGLLVCLV